MAPKLSPDGKTILATGAKYRGLVLLARANGSATSLAADSGAGLEARFIDSETVLFSATRAGAKRSIVVSTGGQARAARAGEVAQPVAVIRAERVYVKDRAGQMRQAATGDRFFGPVTSPNGDWVAFQGLATGIYLYHRQSRELIAIGRGTAPAWSPTGDRLVFERTEDDGHEIVGSDLYTYDLGGRALHRLTDTPSLIERRPSYAASGSGLVFDDDRGSIYSAEITETTESQ